MSKRTRHATREALGLVARQRPQPEEIDALLASIPTRERRDRKAARQQQREDTK